MMMHEFLVLIAALFYAGILAAVVSAVFFTAKFLYHRKVVRELTKQERNE